MMENKLEIYLSKKPAECVDCLFCEKYRYGRRYCSLMGIDLGCFDRAKECLIKSIEEHDAELIAKLERRNCNESLGSRTS